MRENNFGDKDRKAYAKFQGEEVIKRESNRNVGHISIESKSVLLDRQNLIRTASREECDQSTKQDILDATSRINRI